MANYQYDEGGNMAAYFLITFLALALIPVTFSISPAKKKPATTCECDLCKAQHNRVRKQQGSVLFSRKTIFLTLGWSLFGFLCYKTAGAKIENKVYNPFEVLGIKTGLSEKEIKSHFKKLSRQFHPDKVKPTANMTVQMIQDHFVDITKAYKSLTDEVIRKNWELYGHPDGRQETTTGIALPTWIIKGKNNIWVLGLYGLLFGAALPLIVGRWWFGSRQKTKDGINAKSAASFFKSLTEDANMEEVVATLGAVYKWERPVKTKPDVEEVLNSLEKQIADKAEQKWQAVRDLVVIDGPEEAAKRRALILLYAYFLRLDVPRKDLQQEQREILLQTPTLLNAFLTVAIARNWISPVLYVMRLHAYFAQALLPASGDGSSRLRFAQLPGIQPDEVQLSGDLATEAEDYDEFVQALEEKSDSRLPDVKKAMNTWGRLDLVDLNYKVIGERIVTPSSFVFLVLKLRVLPPLNGPPKVDVEDIKAKIKSNEEKDYKFLTATSEAEDLVSEDATVGWAHAPYWPANRKPGWWLVVADEKNNRVVVPPLKITDVPLSGTGPDPTRDYRSYKLQFQAPSNSGFLTWKIYLISDTFIGEEITSNITIKVDEFPDSDDEQVEDEISDPDEDTIEGQMAAMRGGKVKRHEEDSDEESSTDDDEESDESSSDSD